MKYHPDDFLSLSLAVDADGGRLLAEPCVGSVVRLKEPNAKGDMQWQRHTTTHCSQSALMEIPYDPTLHVRLMDDAEPDVFVIDHTGEKGEFEEPKPMYGAPAKPIPKLSMVKVCAVDDAVGLWPRYAGVCSSKSRQP